MYVCDVSLVKILLGKGRYWLRYQQNVSTNEICSWFESDQSQTFAVLCALWALPSQLSRRDLLGNHLWLHLGL